MHPNRRWVVAIEIEEMEAAAIVPMLLELQLFGAVVHAAGIEHTIMIHQGFVKLLWSDPESRIELCWFIDNAIFHYKLCVLESLEVFSGITFD